MGEFELIRQFFQPLAAAGGSSQLLLGPGDDCAIQRVPPGRDLVFSVDTLVEGVHFPERYSPFNLGWRSLAVAASDLAAMGAAPVCFTLALTLPEANEDWLSDFAEGLAKASATFGIALAGGDTTRGPLTLSLQVHGTVNEGEALRRNGAAPGDLICVSGTLGDAGAALAFLDAPSPSDTEWAVLEQYHFPQPRLTLGQQLVGYASAAIDVSDGLLADLQHILDASNVGAHVQVNKVPTSAALRNLEGNKAVNLALTAGDDYQLCVTIAPEQWARLPGAVQAELTVIGQIEASPGMRLDGGQENVQTQGFDHFGRTV
jgi:thiamine-monophosphate kinase